LLPDLNASAVIWTTTPWTIPHNRALAFHPELEYVCVPSGFGFLILAKQIAFDNLEARSLLRIEDGPYRELGKGSNIEGLKFRHPFLNHLQVPAVLANYVTLEQGTGIVHTAPGHGAEDFFTGQKYGLEIAAPLDDEGHYLEGLDAYRGKTVFEANPATEVLCSENGNSPTAIPTVGAATTQSSSAPLSNGSSIWNTPPSRKERTAPPCEKRLCRKLRASRGFLPGEKSASAT
jgi:isoleucyl-tRNA synthetase